jgi:predicted O-methyltransferase YrrM
MKYLDPFLAPFGYLAAAFLNPIRRKWMSLPLTRKAVRAAGVLPQRDHYYDKQFLFANYDDRNPRDLPGVDLNEVGQLLFLEKLTYTDELRVMDIQTGGDSTDYFHFGGSNDQYGPGDFEVLYQIVRTMKPKRLVEIGSGWSTKGVVAALTRNRAEGFSCRHICIEPYESRGLEKLGIELLRDKVEDMDLKLFEGLEAGDILFIDSTHIIRPHGDVLTEYLRILPRLKPGVIVHVHDIFTPYNYPAKWVVEQNRLWDEQYLLEATLGGGKFRPLVANYFMSRNHFQRMKAIAPYLEERHKPGSFWMERV